MVKYISIFSFLVSGGPTLIVYLKVSVLTSNEDKTALVEALSNVSTNNLQIYIKQEQYHLCRSSHQWMSSLSHAVCNPETTPGLWWLHCDYQKHQPEKQRKELKISAYFTPCKMYIKPHFYATISGERKLLDQSVQRKTDRGMSHLARQGLQVVLTHLKRG